MYETHLVSEYYLFRHWNFVIIQFFLVFYHLKYEMGFIVIKKAVKYPINEVIHDI
jgi:hypothetical protein